MMANITSNINVLNFSNNEAEVDKWNDELATGLTLNNAILSLYIVFGIFGNVTVIFIYGLRMKRKTEDRYFIPYLAVADLLASCVCASFGIALNMMQATFGNFRLCKAWWFFAGFTTLTSIFLLLIIAVHRYLKVCKPLGKQMTLRWKRLAMLLALSIAFILSVPMTKFYGSVSFPNPERGITGLRCSKLKSENKTGSLVFGAVLGLIAVTSVASLMGLYGKIGHTIFTHFKRMQKSNNKSNIKISKQKKDMENLSALPGSECILSLDENGTVSTETLNTGDSGIYVSTSTSSNNSLALSQCQEKPKEKLKIQQKTNNNDISRKIMHKFSLMFMLITLIFLVCYIPKVIIMFFEAMNPKFWEQFSDKARAGMLFVYRMFVINNVSNPFIYAFLDEKFRQELNNIFRECKKR